MSGCMPVCLARRLVAGVCCVGRDAAGHWWVCDGAAAQRLRPWDMAAKRGRETLCSSSPTRRRKRTCTVPDVLDYIPLNQTPPRTPSPTGSLHLGDFIFIDTTPTTVKDAPAPPSWDRKVGQGSEDPQVVEVPCGCPTARRQKGRARRESVTDAVYEGPGRGRPRGGGPQVAQRRSCHTRARRGINTQAPAATALATAEEDGVEVVEREEVQVVEGHDMEVLEAELGHPGHGQEVEVIDVSSTEEERMAERGGGGGGRSSSSGGGVEAEDSDSGDGGVMVGSGPLLEVQRKGFLPLEPVWLPHLINTTIDLPDEVLRRRRELEGLRTWEETGLGRRVAQRGMQDGAVPLTVLSYNVLAQSLLLGNPGLYRSCDQTHLSWEYRWALLQHEVEWLRPDVLLLQEVEAPHYHSHYLPWLVGCGYRGLYKKRTGTKADGCAIFYLSNAWRLAEHRTVEYYQPAAPDVLDRDNVGLIARLVPRGEAEGGAGVCVATTHLLYNPRRHDVKLAQVAVLLAELDRLCYMGQEVGQPRYCPMLLTGDLNAEPHTALLSFLRDGRLQYEGLARRTLALHGSYGPTMGPELLPQALGITQACQHASLSQGRWLEGQRGPIISPTDKRRLEEALIHIHHSDRSGPPRPSPSITSDPLMCPGWLTHGFHLQSVYRGRRQDSGRGPEVTTFQERWCCVDYMLYSRRRSPNANLVEGPLKLLARLALPSAKHAAKFGPMPSDVCPSDHFPLAAKFMLTPS